MFRMQILPNPDLTLGVYFYKILDTKNCENLKI